MRWLTRIMACQGKQPAAVRWLEVLVLYAIALGARIQLGPLYGANPSLTFYPLLLIVSFLFGWVEALFVLVLSLIAGLYLFLPPGMYLLPIGWTLVGGLTIAIVSALKAMAQQLADANERQRILFRELQHRVSNTLQSVVGTLEVACRRLDTEPAEARRALEDAVDRFSASARIHRRLNEPELFEQGMNTVLRRAVETVVDRHKTLVSIEVPSFPLSLDQMSVIAMLVIEAANNSQKHVFEQGRGHNFYVAMKALPNSWVVLLVKDDGPGWPTKHASNAGSSLGRTIMRELAKQIGGTLSIKSERGTEISVVFPLSAERLTPTNQPAP